MLQLYGDICVPLPGREVSRVNEYLLQRGKLIHVGDEGVAVSIDQWESVKIIWVELKGRPTCSTPSLVGVLEWGIQWHRKDSERIVNFREWGFKFFYKEPSVSAILQFKGFLPREGTR